MHVQPAFDNIGVVGKVGRLSNLDVISGGLFLSLSRSLSDPLIIVKLCPVKRSYT